MNPLLYLGEEMAKKTNKKAAKKTTTKTTKKASSKKTTMKAAAVPKTVKAASIKKTKAGAKRKPSAAFMKPLTLSPSLIAVIGAGPYPRTEVVKALWKYIKKNDLQDPKNKRNIIADDKLKAVFGGKAVVNMFEMTKLVSKHLT